MAQFRKFSDDKSLFITAGGLVLGVLASVYYGPIPLIAISVAAILYTAIRWYDGSVAEAQKDALINEIKKTVRESIEKKAEEVEETSSKIFINEPPIAGACIKVIGVGGGGGNAVNRMIDAGIKGVEFIVANTDLQALNASKAPVRIQLGSKLTRGLGAGSNPDIGRQAALEDHEKLLDVLEGSDMVFVTAGLGGGTGTGAAPVVASLAIELGALTIAVVTKPFLVEGKMRVARAEQGLADLRGCVDSLVAIPNSSLREPNEPITIAEAFRRADDAILDAIEGIASLITSPGIINLDFADIATIFRSSGDALLGTGSGEGENAASQAMQLALKSPLFKDADLESANAWLVTVCGGPTMALGEVENAVSLVEDLANSSADIVWGSIIKEDIRDEIKITLVATRFNQSAVNWSDGDSTRLKPPKVGPIFTSWTVG